MSTTVYPALDVRGGRIVRLRQGDYDRETLYDDDPRDFACRYDASGAKWLHLVDLDAAREGGYRLASLLRAIKRGTTLCVQTGGGVRDEADVTHILAAGADRVVVGSVAALDPARVAGWIERFGPERIVIALDALRTETGIVRVATHGWTATGPSAFDDLLAFYRDAGALHILCTVIDRDGMLEGPDLDFYERVLRVAPRIALQASGGFRDAHDVGRAFAVGCQGVVLGRALLESRVTLEDTLAC